MHRDRQISGQTGEQTYGWTESKGLKVKEKQESNPGRHFDGKDGREFKGEG